MGKLIRFERKNGKYLTVENAEITTKMLMENEHYINGDDGFIHFEENSKELICNCEYCNKEIQIKDSFAICGNCYSKLHD